MATDEAAPEARSVEPFGAATAGDYTIGYGRPPVATRFRPGQSGNPRGARKGAPHVATIIAAALGERITVKQNDRSLRISKIELAVKQLVNRAAGGDTRATQWLIALAQAQEAKPRQPDAEFDTQADAEVIADLVRRLTERP